MEKWLFLYACALLIGHNLTGHFTSKDESFRRWNATLFGLEPFPKEFEYMLLVKILLMLLVGWTTCVIYYGVVRMTQDGGNK